MDVRCFTAEKQVPVLSQPLDRHEIRSKEQRKRRERGEVARALGYADRAFARRSGLWCSRTMHTYLASHSIKAAAFPADAAVAATSLNNNANNNNRNRGRAGV